MCFIKLSQNQVAVIDKVDMDLIGQYRWCAHKERVAYYALSHQTTENKRRIIKMHRVIMDVADSKTQVDHINHDGLDNRKLNLRICTASQNHMNRKPLKGSTSRFKGVCWHKINKKWRAQIMYNQKVIHIGYFKNEIEAAIAYNEKAIELFGEFANLNQTP